VIPITLLILLALFAVQKTWHRRSDGFGPITWCGFVAIGLLGVMQIVGNPTIPRRLSPHYALQFMFTNPGVTFVHKGAIVLCVSRGAEALYADMGHFGIKPSGLHGLWWSCPPWCSITLARVRWCLSTPEAVKTRSDDAQLWHCRLWSDRPPWPR
jgi:KUP system potassium uptake protein